MHQPISLPEGEVIAGNEVRNIGLRVSTLLENPGVPGSGFPGIQSIGSKVVREGGMQLVIDGKVIRQGNGVRFVVTGSEQALWNLLLTRPGLARILSLRVAL